MNSSDPDPMKFWQHVHGASSHFPIALVIVAVFFELGAIVLKKTSWRLVGFWSVVLAAVASVPTVLSGLTGQLGWLGNGESATTLAGSEYVILHRNVSLWGGGAILLLALWRVLREKSGMKQGELSLYLVALVAAMGAIGYTGYLGAYVGKGY